MFKHYRDLNGILQGSIDNVNWVNIEIDNDFTTYDSSSIVIKPARLEVALRVLQSLSSIEKNYAFHNRAYLIEQALTIADELIIREKETRE